VKKPDLDQVYEYMLKDKKNKDNEISFVLLKTVGDPVYDIKCNYEEMTRAYDYYQSTMIPTT
jgi:3-dehydroquinate synthase